MLDSILDKCIAGKGAEYDEALYLAMETDINDLLHGADLIRQKYFGNKIVFCSIVNAKSGLCPNDCAFCAQSAHYSTGVGITGLIEPETARLTAKDSARNGSRNFGIVTSGVSPDDSDMDKILEAVRLISSDGEISPCASLGEIGIDHARSLSDAGLDMYHHNLETSERFYPSICTTGDYVKKLQTLENVRKAGLKICCGGIFGLGEDWTDRIDMAMTMRSLGVDSVPINFLKPVKGTPLGNMPEIHPLEALRIIALYRFVFPTATIKVCGGREHILRDLQSWMFHAGANSAMIGNYLTTAGRAVEDDLKMVKDLGLEIDNGRQISV